ncbi:hypothetical protein BDA96_06G052600 [Sorghum bicolor]|uniref:Uncharacterized protein n=1 Tax=Sorghum bicolor TaxID=4558 RepID=A0A921QPC1_SORBI|nr:hypothetical protein BDA96_06G052600 [Sorghum bicolor]
MSSEQIDKTTSAAAARGGVTVLLSGSFASHMGTAFLLHAWLPGQGTASPWSLSSPLTPSRVMLLQNPYRCLQPLVSYNCCMIKFNIAKGY